MIAVGFGGTAFGIFIKTIQEAMGWGRAQIVAAFTIYVLIQGLFSPFIGRFVETIGARRIICAGSFIAMAGFLILSRMNSLGLFYLGYILVGIGFTAAGPFTASYVVSHWFAAKRGRAIGIMSMGIGCGSVTAPPLVALLLIPHLGWSNAYVFLAVVNAAIIVPLSIFVVRSKPADLGLFPDGVKPSADPGHRADNHSAAARPSTQESLTLRMALSTAAFWFIGLSLFLNHTHLGVNVSVYPHLRDMSFSAGIAASVISTQGMMVFLGMFFFGWICDKIKAQYASAIGLGLVATGIAILITVGPGSPKWYLFLYAVIMGFGVGSWMPTMSMLTSSIFGIASYGAIFGVVSMFQCLGGATGPLLAGYIYDRTHIYRWAFLIILAMVISAIPLVLKARRPQMRQEGNH